MGELQSHSEIDNEAIKPDVDSPEHSEIKEVTRGHELLELSKEEVAKLIERIDKFDGTIRLFVHPLFGYLYKNSEEDSGMSDSDYKEAARKSVTATMKVLSAKPEDTPPVLVFEEDQMFESSSKLYNKIADVSGQDYYLVETHHNKSTPRIAKTAENDDREFLGDPESWSIFIEILKQLGVKKIIAGGASFRMKQISDEDEKEFHEDLDAYYGSYRRQRLKKGAKNIQYTIGHCLGTAVNHLSHEFDISLSNLTYPDTRKDRREIEKGK